MRQVRIDGLNAFQTREGICRSFQSYRIERSSFGLTVFSIGSRGKTYGSLLSGTVRKIPKVPSGS